MVFARTYLPMKLPLNPIQTIGEKDAAIVGGIASIAWREYALLR
jgi:hypothetical protein